MTLLMSLATMFLAAGQAGLLSAWPLADCDAPPAGVSNPETWLRSITAPCTSGRLANWPSFALRVEISFAEPAMRVGSHRMRVLSPVGMLDAAGGVKGVAVTPAQMPPDSVTVRLNGVEGLAGPATRTYI